MPNLIYAPPANLQRETKPERGGLCNVYYIPVERVVAIPEPDSPGGTIATGIIQVDGTAMWFRALAPYEKGYNDESKVEDAGISVPLTVKAKLASMTLQNHITLDRLKYHRFIVIVERPSGLQLVVGTLANPARLSFASASGNSNKEGANQVVTFTWQNEDKPLVYEQPVFPVAP